MQIVGLYPKGTESETRDGPQHFRFYKALQVILVHAEIWEHSSKPLLSLEMVRCIKKYRQVYTYNYTEYWL